MTVDVRAGELWLDGQCVPLEHAVHTAEELPDGDVLIMYDNMADTRSSNERAQGNLLRMGRSGEVRWMAQLPDGSTDAYVSLVSIAPIVAVSWSCYRCTIDARTGRIVERVFTK